MLALLSGRALDNPVDDDGALEEEEVPSKSKKKTKRVKEQRQAPVNKGKAKVVSPPEESENIDYVTQDRSLSDAFTASMNHPTTSEGEISIPSMGDIRLGGDSDWSMKSSAGEGAACSLFVTAQPADCIFFTGRPQTPVLFTSIEGDISRYRECTYGL